MTNLEATNAVAGFALPDANIASKALEDVDLVPSETYTKANSEKVDQAAISVLVALKLYSKIDEGGFGVTFNTAAADKTIRFLYEKLGGASSGLPDPFSGEGTYISDASYNW